MPALLPYHRISPSSLRRFYRLDFIQCTGKSTFSIESLINSNIVKNVTKMRTLKLDFCRTLIKSTIVINFFKTLFNMLSGNWTWYKRCNIRTSVFNKKIKYFLYIQDKNNSLKFFILFFKLFLKADHCRYKRN